MKATIKIHPNDRTAASDTIQLENGYRLIVENENVSVLQKEGESGSGYNELRLECDINIPEGKALASFK